MIIWLNQPFGAGKTTTARLLLESDPALAFFDTEHIGYLLRPALEIRRPVADFQDWPTWRRLTVQTLAAVSQELSADVVVPQRSWNSSTGRRSPRDCTSAASA